MRLSKPKRRWVRPGRPVVYKAPRVGGALIDEQLPRYDFRDAFQVVIVASPDVVYDAVRRLDLPALTMLGAFEPIAERPGSEIVLGAIGSPWRSDCGPVRFATSDFAAFSQPGFAKIAWSWIVKPLGSGQSLLVVEFRAQLTDADALAEFRRFWPPVAGTVRRMARTALARVKHESEGAATRTSTPS
jgi:hypothetical protein